MHSELLRLQSHYTAVRKRLWGKPQKAANENTPEVVVSLPVKKLPPPSWKMVATHFDTHVNEWRRHKFNKYISFINTRCDALGISYERFTNVSRRGKGDMALCMIRHQIRWELKRAYPELTLLQMSRMCGNVDHSSIIGSIKKMDRLLSNGYKLLGEENAGN